MARLKKMIEREHGWCDDVFPIMRGYKMACCDCGLVHDMQFEVGKIVKENKDGSFVVDHMDPNKYRVIFRARRNNRSTGQVRRHKARGEGNE